MFKVLIKTLFRSYVMPKIRGGTPEGWYNTLESIE
jgi:hypothetical protein